MSSHPLPINKIKRKNQTGSALVLSIMVVSFVELLVVALLVNQRILIRQTDNLVSSSQAYYYALSGEDWAVGHLNGALTKFIKDKTAPLKRQYELPKSAIPNGSLSSTLIDMQSFYNINNLNNPAAIPNFVNILLSLDPKLNLETANKIAADLLKKLNRETTAENPAPPADQNKPVPPPSDTKTDINTKAFTVDPQANSAFNKFDSISELRTIQSLSVESLNKISPYLCALPEATGLNINTAPAEILKLVLNTGSDLRIINAIIKAREMLGYIENQDQLLSIIAPDPDGNNSPSSPINMSNITFNSQYYLSSTHVVYKDMHLILHSLLYIQASEDKSRFNITVLRRSRNSL